jgi:hypothetical protein
MTLSRMPQMHKRLQRLQSVTILDRRAIHIHDVLADPEYNWSDDLRRLEEMHRTILAVPMIRDAAP